MEPNTSQPIMPAPSPQLATPTPTIRGKKNKGLLIGIIVAAVLVVAGAAWAAYALFFAATPESLMKDALKNLSQTNKGAVDFEVNSQGANLTGNLAATTDSSNKNSEVILTFGEGDQSIVLRLLTADDALFLKTANIELVAPLVALYTGSEAFNSPDFIDALKNVNDTWFEVTKEQLDSLTESTGQNAAAISAEEFKKILQIYDQHPFVKPGKTYADETVNGKQSAHFSVVVDKQQEVAFLEALKAADLQGITLTDEDIAKLKDSADSQNSTMEVWIARDTKTFTKLSFASTAEDQQVTITLTATQPPAFDALERPADARPISDFMSILLSASPIEDIESLESELMY